MEIKAEKIKNKEFKDNELDFKIAKPQKKILKSPLPLKKWDL